MTRPNGRRFTMCFILGALAFAPAQAKVLFTGYADFQATAQSAFKIDGSPAVLGLFGLGQSRLESRGAAIDSIGLFAATSLSDDTRLLMDVTYRDIGLNAKTIRLQYAYLEHSAFGGQVLAGKITLPFGYYNQNRFYPFQRPSISGPVFQAGILGLPMSDIGAAAGRAFQLGGATLKADVYAVNGFGPVPGSTTSFRSATLPGGLTIANNIASRDANHRVALGGRLDLGHAALGDSSLGVSYYRDQWNPSGQGLFQMGGAHLHANVAGIELLSEYLLLTATGDQGMLANFGVRNWRTDGFFAEADYKKLSVLKKPVTPWVRFEDYFTHAGAGGRENLWELAGGVSVQALDGVAVKAEVSDLYYRLPFQSAGGDLILKGYSLLLGLAVTF